MSTYYAKSLSRVQLFATPWTDPPGSSVLGILQARILGQDAISFSSTYYGPDSILDRKGAEVTKPSSL